MIKSFAGLIHKERLYKLLNLTTLKTRRLREDLIDVFKILKGFEDINYQNFYTIFNIELRRHSPKLYKSRSFFICNTENSFSQRIINEWNKLNTNVLECSSFLNFKVKTYKYLKSRGLCKSFATLHSPNIAVV